MLHSAATVATVTIPLPPPSNYGSRDPGYPALPRGMSTSSSQHPGGEPVRIHPLAFLSVVLAFCAPVFGLILGIIAVIQTREPGSGGRGVAWVGTILSLVTTVGLVMLTIQLVAAGPSR
jgi:hypothetical protein